MWSTCQRVKYLLTFVTLCGFNFLSQSFVGVTLGKLKLGKVWLQIKQTHRPKNPTLAK
jgi:hypothetical protein